MKKITKKILLLSASLFFAFSMLSIGALSDKKNAVAQELNVESEILASYSLGSEFIVPKGSISYNGKTYEASPILFYPDGMAYEKDVYNLSSTGQYTVSYGATIDGENISLEKKFIVYSDAYEVSANMVLEYRDSLEKVGNSSVSGLFVSLPENDAFTYNEAINIYDYNAEKPLIRFHPYSNGGEGTTHRESLRQIIRLTDCYNAENYIDFILSWDYSDHISKTAAMFYRASVAGSKSIGLRTTTENTRYKYKDQYYLVRDSQYGAAIPQYKLTDDGVTVYFDPIENVFYAEGASKVLVSKLDSVELYGDYAFTGFTTGEVYLSILGEQYYESAVNMEISMLAGYEEKELHMHGVFDRKNPNVVINLNDDTDVLYVAKNENVLLPKANVYDVNWDGKISVAVYSGYGTESCRRISCPNGIFTPKTEGRYTVEYTAKDTFGNKTVETLLISCVSMPNNKSIDLAVEELEELTAGSICQLPDYTATGLNGTVSVKEYYRFGEDGDKIPVPAEGFLVQYVGEYQIIYEYTDGFMSYEKIYSVDSKASGNITFDIPVLPEYLIANASYSFDDVCAYSYTDEIPTKHDTKIYLITDGNKNTETEVDYQNVKIPNCSKVNFRYVYDGYDSYSQEIPVVDVGFGSSLNMEQYFVGDFEKSSDGNGIYYLSNKNTETNTLSFINTVSISSFSFAFTVVKGFNAFAAVDICLTDYYDRNNSVKISYLNESGDAVFSCDGSEINTQQAFEDLEHKCYYSLNDGGFYDTSGKLIAWRNNFSSDKVLLSVTLRGLKGASKLKITELCGTTFSDEEFDYFRPILDCEDVGGVKSLGDKITLRAASAIDVLCPFLRENLMMEVTSPTGKKVVSDDEITLGVGCATDRDYTFTLTENGKYRVSYSYSDNFGNMLVFAFFANVIDTVAPTIVLDDGYNETTMVNARLNSTITLKGYAVSDDKTESSKLIVKVMAYSPSSEQVFIVNNSFKATKKGTYTVYYYVYDEIGNYSVASYKIMVK